MILQTPGSFLFCYMIASSPGTNISSWISFFIGGCLQGTLLIICLYHSFEHKGDFLVISSEETFESETESPLDSEINLEIHSK